MSYRVHEHKPKKPNRTAQKTSTAARYYMENGTTFRLAIPCWYYDVRPPIRARHHCKPWHDHVGQPSPHHPDHVCQVHDFASECHAHNHYGFHHPHHCHHSYIDMAKLIPIHLTKEGYTKVSVAFDNLPEGLLYDAWIDETDDWVVRVFFDADVKEAIDKPVDTRFIIKVIDEEENRVDTVARGKLRIEPAPLEADDE